MDAKDWALFSLALALLFSVITHGIFHTGWGRRKILERIIELAQHGDKKSQDILDDIKRKWRA